MGKPSGRFRQQFRNPHPPVIRMSSIIPRLRTTEISRFPVSRRTPIELHLLCRDSFGLSYDFTACTYEIDQDGTMAEEVWPDTDYNVRVSWEK